jgi:hypothetical protein
MKLMKFEAYTWKEGSAPKLRGGVTLNDEGFFSDAPGVGIWLQQNALPILISLGVQGYLDSRMNRQDAPYHLKLIDAPDMDTLTAVGSSWHQHRLYGFDGRYWSAVADFDDVGRVDPDSLPQGSDEYVGRAYDPNPQGVPTPVAEWELFDGSIYKHLPVDFIALIDPLPNPY